MTDFAAHFHAVPVASRSVVQRQTRRSAQVGVFTAALSISLAVGLTVPSSEVRAKAFRLGLIAKSVHTRMTHL